MTAGLVFLYIIHVLKIMLALWASPQINFFKRKKRKKESPFDWWQVEGCQGF